MKTLIVVNSGEEQHFVCGETRIRNLGPKLPEGEEVKLNDLHVGQYYTDNLIFPFRPLRMSYDAHSDMGHIIRHGAMLKPKADTNTTDKFVCCGMVSSPEYTKKHALDKDWKPEDTKGKTCHSLCGWECQPIENPNYIKAKAELTESQINKPMNINNIKCEECGSETLTHFSNGTFLLSHSYSCKQNPLNGGSGLPQSYGVVSIPLESPEEQISKNGVLITFVRGWKELKKGDKVVCLYGNSGNKFWTEILDTLPVIEEVIEHRSIPNEIKLQGHLFHANDFAKVVSVSPLKDRERYFDEELFDKHYHNKVEVKDREQEEAVKDFTSLISLVKDGKQALQWLWDVAELPEDKKYLQSDLFNIPANGITALELALEQLTTPKEETEGEEKLTEGYLNSLNFTTDGSLYEFQGYGNKYGIRISKTGGRLYVGNANAIPVYSVKEFKDLYHLLTGNKLTPK